MKITISPVTVGPAWGTEVVLVPGGEASPEGIEISGQQDTDIVHALRSLVVVPIDRGNRSHSMSFSFTSENASVLLSEKDLILYTNSLPKFGLVRFYAETSLNVVFAFMIAALKDFRLSQVGVASLRSFSLVGGAIVTTIPNPPAPFP